MKKFLLALLLFFAPLTVSAQRTITVPNVVVPDSLRAFTDTVAGNYLMRGDSDTYGMVVLQNNGAALFVKLTREGGQVINVGNWYVADRKLGKIHIHYYAIPFEIDLYFKIEHGSKRLSPVAPSQSSGTPI